MKFTINSSNAHSSNRRRPQVALETRMQPERHFKESQRRLPRRAEERWPITTKTRLTRTSCLSPPQTRVRCQAGLGHSFLLSVLRRTHRSLFDCSLCPPPPGAPLYIARCTASRTTSGSEGSGCHQAQRTGGGEPQRGVLPSRCLSGALTFLTHIQDSICRQKESTFLTIILLVFRVEFSTF